jgi:hypothetical protein
MANSKFQRVHWPVTIRYNVMRGVAAGSLVYLLNLLGILTISTPVPEGLLLIPFSIFVAFPIGITAWWLETRGQRWVNLLVFVITMPLLLGDLVLYLLNFLVPDLIEGDGLKVATVSAAVIYIRRIKPPYKASEDIPDTPTSIWKL